MNTKKIIILVSVLAVILVLVFTSFSIVGPTERGIKVTLGVADEEILGPGLKFKAPFFQKVQKYDLTPIQYASAFNSVTDAAITLDKQSILVNFELFWRYDESKLYNVATRYKTRESLYQPISTSLKGIIKDCVGKKSINEITANQSQLTNEVMERLVNEISYLPILVDKFTITNIDWSAEYDKQIEETAKLSQQVLKKLQNLVNKLNKQNNRL